MRGNGNVVNFNEGLRLGNAELFPSRESGYCALELALVVDYIMQLSPLFPYLNPVLCC
jgi:hypothetical protein